jgi:hypothetical protein
MRNRRIELLSALALAATMATAGCSSSEETGSTGGTSGTTGGTSGSTGGTSGTTGGTSSAAGGTSGTGGASTANSVTALAGTTVLSTLTTDQATQLCSDTWAYFAAAISAEAICKYQGLSFATSSSAPTEEKLRSNCSSKETPCLADPGSAWTTNPGCSEIPTDCGATVAEYSTCIQDTAAGFNQAVSAMPGCAEFTNTATSPVWDLKGADRLPSCELPSCDSLWPPDPKNF